VTGHWAQLVVSASSSLTAVCPIEKREEKEGLGSLISHIHLLKQCVCVRFDFFLLLNPRSPLSLQKKFSLLSPCYIRGLFSIQLLPHVIL